MNKTGRIMRSLPLCVFALLSRAESVLPFCFLPTASRVPGFRMPLALTFRGVAEKVLENPKWPDSWPYNDSVDFAVMDPSDDEIFYDQPRLVYHIDDPAVSALTKFYAKNLQEGDDVLDICSSWVSHYPETFKGGKVIGVGMNEYELSQNPQLTDYVVQNLNKDSRLPFEDASFDKGEAASHRHFTRIFHYLNRLRVQVTCVVSIDYLTNPRKVAQEIGRVLRPGGEAIVSISNRCFPTKAVQIWLQTNDLEHIFIVGSFFHYAGCFEPPKCVDVSPSPGLSDPLYIISAKRK